MMRIRYHPLVDRDTDGTDKYPLFLTEDDEEQEAREPVR
jgi:hypothetical protein